MAKQMHAVKLAMAPEEVARYIDVKPGVYLFRQGQKILYVGKARNLRKRVSSYMRPARLDNKSRRLMERCDNLQFTLTASEGEALLLEQNLIKEYKPPYNILLRDDKFYPYIFVSDHRIYPLISFHRGPHKRKGHYYGPYPHARLVHQSLELIQKTFQVRSCSDSFFANRTRPCLQYQMKRCSAPCVGAITQEEYGKSIQYVEQFLRGKDDEIIAELTKHMQQASEELRFEDAAHLRDQISALRSLQQKQHAEQLRGRFGDFDALSVRSHAELACVYVLMVRRGKVLVGTHYFFRAPVFDTERQLLPAFIAHYYLKHHRELPTEILVPFDWPGREELAHQIGDHCGVRLRIAAGVRGMRKGWLDMAEQNCAALLTSALAKKYTEKQQLSVLQTMLNLPTQVERIECFDVSHSSGEAAQAACVVWTTTGAAKEYYRRYNIDGIQPGDDYAAMAQAIMRRYQKVVQADAPNPAQALPQLVLVDGGRGQLNRALNVLEDLNVRDMVVIAIAKGEQRKFGREIFYVSDRLCGGSEDLRVIEYSRSDQSAALNILLRVRDEAHRFVLRGHKRKRDQRRMASGLDRITGLGEERKKALLRHFGGLDRVKQAGVADIIQVPGFGRILATSVFEQLHK